MAKLGVKGDTEKKVDFLTVIVYAIVVVLFIGFLSLIISVSMSIGANIQSGLAEKTTSYQNLIDKINSQSLQINTLSNKIDVLEDKITYCGK